MGTGIRRVVVRVLILASVVVLGFVTQAAYASASVNPMTFDECGTNADNGAYNCMYIEGGGDSAIEVRGWADKVEWGYPVHEEVQEPDGNAFCNSSTVTPSSEKTIISCQGGPENIPVGTWCAIVWLFNQAAANGAGAWGIAAENCGNVSV
jgi:hypothetical protein